MPKTKKQKNIQEEFIMVEKPYKKIAITFIVLAGLLLAGICYFSLSNATIYIIPKEEAKTKTFTAQINFKENSVPENLNGNYEEKSIDIIKNFDVENFKTEQGKSGGIITIINKGAKNQTLIATTRFLAPNNFLFRLKNTVVVPANGEIKAEIEADEAGSKYDIAPTTFTIPGLSDDLQKKIYGVSSITMSGGIKKIGTLTAEEIANAQKTVLADLDKEILDKLEKKDGEFLLFQKEIKNQNVSNKEGYNVEKFSITIKINVKTLSISKENALEWAKNQYQKSISESEEIKSFDLNSLNLELVSITSEFAEVKVSISANVLGEPNVNLLEKQKLYGLDAKGVKFYLTQFENIKDVEIKFSPFWVKTVPSLADHVEIKVKE
jgi:hypothetical protein